MQSFTTYYNELKYIPNINKISKELLFDDLFIRNLQGKDKLKDIEDVNQEDLLKTINGGIPISGLIYTFLYKGEFTQENLKFKTKFPIILVTNFSLKFLEGVDLNLMPKNIRLIFLEAFYKMFKDEFDSMEVNLQNNINHLNNKFIGLIKAGKLRDIFSYIYKLTGYNISMCYRKYDITLIDNIRLIELNNWKYIPFYIPVDVITGINYEQLYKKFNK